MRSQVLHQQNNLLQHRERILSAIKKYPNVVNVGVGLKEVNNELTSMLCYRVYVNEKKDPDQLQEHEIIPRHVDGFITDVIPHGEVVEISMDNEPYRPLRGGIQIKNDLYVDNKTRGGGTLGCLVISSEDPDMILGLTNEHVVAWNSQDVPDGVNDVGQPWKRICCCCCVRDVVGKVYDSLKNEKIDCATIELHSDIVNQIKSGGTINEIEGIGSFKGKAKAEVGMLVKKRGAGTGLTHGIVKDVAFDDHQLLIGPVDPDIRFANFGDSGSIILNEDNRVVGLLWAAERNRFWIPNEPILISSNLEHKIDPRIHGVATPIEAVIEAMNIVIPEAPPVTPTYSIHSDDAKTHLIPSTLPSSTNKHFVTVKGTGDVILKVTFDQPVDPSRVKWVSKNNLMMPITSPAVGTDPFTAKISRNVAVGSMSEVEVKVDGYSVGEKVFVWIIWSAIKDEDKFFSDIDIHVHPVQTSVHYAAVFRYTIEPSSIIEKNIETKDLPDLRGANVTPPPNVPDTDTGVYQKGVDLSAGASSKWDGSVRLRCKGSHPGIFLPGGFNEFLPNYPGDPLVGNFDTSASSFDEPYSDLTGGKIAHTTVIDYEVPQSVGITGEKVSTRVQLQEFARVELDGHWYVISDPLPWQIHIKLKKIWEAAEGKDYDGDGSKLSEVWIDDSTETIPNNNDF